MNLLNLAAWLFVIGLGLLALMAVVAGVSRMAGSIENRITGFPEWWRDRHARRAWKRHCKEYRKRR